MPRLTVNGVVIEYESIGSGDPVVFVHGVFVSSAFAPVAEDAALSAFRRVLYARRGYAGSSHPPGPTSLREQAADCAGLVAELGIGRAHIVGHSYGGAVALELAMASPELVRSLSLLEPALLVGNSAEGYRTSLQRTTVRASESGAATAIQEFLEMRSPGFRPRLDRATPGAWDQAVRDASTALDHELPSLLEWTFGENEARRIAIPTLLLLGDDSRQLSPRFQETFDSLLEWLPEAIGAVIPKATHLMQYDAPAAVAAEIAGFLGKRRRQYRREKS